MASVVGTPVGYWTGLYFGIDVTSSWLDLTTIVSAVMLATYPNQTVPVIWACSLSIATAQTLTLNHPWGPNDTKVPGNIVVEAVLTDNHGLEYPLTKVQCVVKA